MTQIKRTAKLSKYLFFIGVASILAFISGSKNNNESEYISDSNPVQIPLINTVHADVSSGGSSDTLGGEGSCDGGGGCDGAP